MLYVIRFLVCKSRAEFNLFTTSAGDPTIKDALNILFNSVVISASSISEGESTPITSRHFCYNAMIDSTLIARFMLHNILHAYRRRERRLAHAVWFYARCFLLTDAIISPITPIPQPISSTVVFGVGLSISATVLATFSAPAAFDQKFVFGAS